MNPQTAMNRRRLLLLLGMVLVAIVLVFPPQVRATRIKDLADIEAIQDS